MKNAVAARVRDTPCHAALSSGKSSAMIVAVTTAGTFKLTKTDAVPGAVTPAVITIEGPGVTHTEALASVAAL